MAPQQRSFQKQQLRQMLRERRHRLSASEQHLAGQRLRDILCQQDCYLKSHRIALYLANDGEIDPKGIAHQAWQQGKQCFLPVLHPQRPGWLQFMPWLSSTHMKKNRFGIPEPDANLYQPVPVWSLDLILLPLTGFDRKGHRMGMGGGFYDRTFAFIKTAERIRSPQLIGLAHECQRVDHLPVDSRDVPLAAIASDRQLYTIT